LLSDRVGYVGPNFSSAVGGLKSRLPISYATQECSNQGMGSCGSVDPSHLLSFAPDKVC